MRLTVQFVPGQRIEWTDIGGDSVEAVYLFFRDSDYDFTGAGDMKTTFTFLEPSGALIRNPISFGPATFSPIGGGYAYASLTDSTFSFSGYIAEIELVQFKVLPDPNAFVDMADLIFQSRNGLVDAHRPAPVPEPAAVLLLGSGIAVLAGTRLRRKKQ